MSITDTGLLSDLLKSDRETSLGHIENTVSKKNEPLIEILYTENLADMKMTIGIVYHLLLLASIEGAVIHFKNKEDNLSAKLIFNQPKPSNYYLELETSSGVIRKENGFLKQLDNGNVAFKMVGFYRFNDTNNRVYQVNYIADEKGFHSKVKMELLNENLSGEMHKNTTPKPPIQDLGVGKRLDLPPALIGSLLG